MKKVIELIRVSTEGQAADNRASIPAQREVNRRTAAQFGLTIVRTIEMTDVSGAAVLLAPEMQELLRLMQAPEIHGVVAKEFSRLMRPENFSDYALLQAFADTNTILYLPEGPLDLASKEGRLMAPIRAAIAGLERTEILERVFHAKESKRRAGKMPQSAITLPFGVGYDKDAETWHFKPEAEKIREAFRLFLAGETSYSTIGKKLGIAPYNLRIILRNPIYTGWRVIDKRRDPSAASHKAKRDGRQADRPKIARSPEDIIRVKVIEEPLVSAEDFARVQQIMDMKKKRHWRTREDYQHRFTYNGFLICDDCGRPIQTHFRRRDYYICSGRKEQVCQSRYMRKEILEPKLDCLFGDRLSDRSFLELIADQWYRSMSLTEPRGNVQRLQGEMASLRTKRERVLELYIESVITKQERDAKLAAIEADIQVYSDLLLKSCPDQTLTAAQLATVFATFTEWEFLGRENKRALLACTVPEIHIGDGEVVGIKLLPPFGTEMTHTDTDSWPPPA